MIKHSSAGTWHGMGRQREIYDLLFPKNRNDEDNFIIDGKFEIDEDGSTWKNQITLNLQVKDTVTPLNDISKIQFGLNLVNNFKVEDIEKAMLRYVEEELPERLI
jgi:hypothetical protein